MVNIELDLVHRRFTLNVGLEAASVTGIITSIDVAGDFSPQNISPNDILGITTERMLVLNVDEVNGKIKSSKRIRRRYWHCS